MSIDKIGVIGAGAMGGSFVRGWLKHDPGMAKRIMVNDVARPLAERLSEETGVGLADDNLSLIEASDLILIAVKPGDVDHALDGSGPLLSDGRVLVSIAAGRTIASLEVLFRTEVAIVRLMPNVGVQVQSGTICFAAGPIVGQELEQEVQEIFSNLGTVIPLPEKLFDAATAISGSGPGFLAVILDAFIDGGVTAGLTPEIASRLACSMMEGTGRLLVQTGLSPADLRHRVASPGGTTAAGIVQLEREGARSAIIDAVQAAVKRSSELG